MKVDIVGTEMPVAGVAGFRAAKRRAYSSPLVTALVETAEAFRTRGYFLQYDDSRLVAGSDTPVTYRFQWSKKSPEDATSQFTGYTNCACFTYDVYYQALGFDIVAWTTDRLIAAEHMIVFRHMTTGEETEQEKKEIHDRFIAALRPGDIINMRYKGDCGGHAMFYAGDGLIIHSTATGGGSYDYEAKAEKFEARGSVEYMDVEALFDPQNRRYFFGNHGYVIVRPLNVYKGGITENTRMRVQNLYGVFAEKLTSAPSLSVRAGQELTFSFRVVNGNAYEVALDIEDTLPYNTEYLIGGTNGKLLWHITLAAGAEQTVSYKVRVRADALADAEIKSAHSTVGGVCTQCPALYVSHIPNEAELAEIGREVTGADGAHFCKKCLPGLPDASLSELILRAFKPYKNSQTHFEPNFESEAGRLIAPRMYGGRYVATADAFGGERAREVRPHHLLCGDLILCTDDKNAENTLGFVYAGEGRLLDISAEKSVLLSKEDSDKVLWSLLGYDRFAILRTQK